MAINMALDADTEGWVVAAQDGVIRTREFRCQILKEPNVPEVCRLCGVREETLGHILAHCPAHEWGLMKDRHDRLFYLLVRAVMKSLGLKLPVSLRREGGVVRGVFGTAKVVVLVDQVIPICEAVSVTCPDLVVKFLEKKRIVIFDVACAWEPIVGDREKEKWQKYQPLGG